MEDKVDFEFSEWKAYKLVKKTKDLLELIRTGLEGLAEWITELFEQFFELAKKEKRKATKNTHKKLPKDIPSS